MSRATVRAGIAAWLTNEVAGINTVYAAMPKIIPATAYVAGQPAGTPSGAACVVHIDRETEPRIALGGNTSGKKQVTYEIGLLIRFRSVRPKAEDAMADYDALIEGLKERIRADRTLGTSGSSTPLLEAGDRGPGIEIDSDLPRVNKDGATFIWGLVRFTAEEIITA